MNHSKALLILIQIVIVSIVYILLNILVTIGPLNENIIKPIDIKNDNIRTKISSSLFSLKNNLTNKQSTMPLTKNSAQLTSKNNNKRTIKIKRQGNSYASKRKLKRSTRR